MIHKNLSDFCPMHIHVGVPGSIFLISGSRSQDSCTCCERHSLHEGTCTVHVQCMNIQYMYVQCI